MSGMRTWDRGKTKAEVMSPYWSLLAPSVALYIVIGQLVGLKYLCSYERGILTTLCWPWVLLVLMQEYLQKRLTKLDPWLVTAAVVYMLNFVFWVGFVVWKAVQ